jgi:hypothetical protein
MIGEERDRDGASEGKRHPGKNMTSLSEQITKTIPLKTLLHP